MCLKGNHVSHHVKPVKQKLSLDSNHYQRGHHVYHHHHHPGVHQTKKNKKHMDSFSDDDSEDESEICDSNFVTQTEISGAAPSILSSETDTTTFFDSENDDDDGQFSSITGDTTMSTMASRKYGQNRNRKRHKHKMPHTNYLKSNSLHSSMSSLTDSTMSLNIITVTLNMDTVNFLGISIVGQSNKGGEGGIYVGSIMNG